MGQAGQDLIFHRLLSASYNSFDETMHQEFPDKEIVDTNERSLIIIIHAFLALSDNLQSPLE